MGFVSHISSLTATILSLLLVVDPAECGITGLHKWFSSTFPNAVKEIQKGDMVETDHLLFDMNQLLHQAALMYPSATSDDKNNHTSKHADGENRVIRALRAIIHSTFKRFRVTQSVVFAFDGVPPLAKLAISQQRRQRANHVGHLSACIDDSFGVVESHKEGFAARDSVEERQSMQGNELRGAGVQSDRLLARATRGATESWKDGYSIPSYILSPGTPFMELVEREFTKLVKQLLRSRRFASVKFFVSGPSSYGEGELKLADWITVASDSAMKDAPEDRSTEFFRALPSHSIVIIGGDADLVVQCLALPHTSNLFVYNPQAISKTRRSRVLYSLRALLGELERLFPGKSHLIRNDFALLCILNGNDYLPKIPGFSFASLASAYAAARCRSDSRTREQRQLVVAFL